MEENIQVLLSSLCPFAIFSYWSFRKMLIREEWLFLFPHTMYCIVSRSHTKALQDPREMKIILYPIIYSILLCIL